MGHCVIPELWVFRNLDLNVERTEGIALEASWNLTIEREYSHMITRVTHSDKNIFQYFCEP